MAFEYRFNVIRFYSKLNRFVLSPRKKPNHFVLKIRPGGFADYNFPFFTYSYKKKSITLPRVNQNKHNVDILIQQNNKHQKL